MPDQHFKQLFLGNIIKNYWMFFENSLQHTKRIGIMKMLDNALRKNMINNAILCNHKPFFEIDILN